MSKTAPSCPKIKKEGKVPSRRRSSSGRSPRSKFPLRSLANVNYVEKHGYFEIGGKKKVRTLTVNTVKTFAQTLRMMALSKELVETNDFATKRDAYYLSKNWDDARFDEQTESDTVMDDIEASLRGEPRAAALHPRGARRRGRRQADRARPRPETGKTIASTAPSSASGAYSIPISVEHL